jgi:1-phosphofructokinase family hexose kinase
MKFDFLVVCLNPTIQKTIILNNLKENEVNRSSEYRTDAAGKGVNTTRILHQLGANVKHLTQSGDQGEYLLELIARDSLPLSTADNSSYIRTCTTLINKCNGTVTEIVEESPSVDSETGKHIMDIYKNLLGETKYIILAGSKAAGFEDNIFPEMVRLAKNLNKTVLLDYRGEDLRKSVIYKPDIIKINFPEFVSTFFPNFSVGEHEENIELKTLVIEKIKKLLEKYGIRTILTRGTMPVLYIDNKAVIKEEEIFPVKTVNTIGCGDAFTAGIVFELHQAKSLEKAVKFGIECGSKNAALLRPGVIR